MKFIFDWTNNPNKEKTKWREDAQIISMKLTHQEFSFATAKVIIATKNKDFLNQTKYAKIGVQINNDEKIKCIFCGKLTSFPSFVEASYMQIELIAEPINYQQQLKNFINKNFQIYKNKDQQLIAEKEIEFDELFYPNKELTNPTIFLESANNIFHWNMDNGKLEISHINNGKNNFRINSSDILENSMRIMLAREPYKKINISINTNWTQRSSGIFDLIPFISETFKGGIINSFTNIQKGIENAYNISNYGYNVKYCKIKTHKPYWNPYYLDKFPKYSQILQAKHPENNENIQVKFKRFYFKGNIFINWNQSHGINETLNLSVINEDQRGSKEKTLHYNLNPIQQQKEYPYWKPLTSYEDGEKTLHEGYIFQSKTHHKSKQIFDETKWTKIQKIPDALCDTSVESFFQTNRGKNAIKYAIQKAIALIKYSNRYIQVHISIPAKKFMHLNLKDQITIEDPRLPNGKIIGKINRIKYNITSTEKIIHLSIASNMKTIEESYKSINEKINQYIKEINIKLTPTLLKNTDLIKHIEIKNQPEQQLQLLSSLENKTLKEIQKTLEKHQTKIKVLLHSLNKGKKINRQLDLEDFHI